jgi:hypothetical protein
MSSDQINSRMTQGAIVPDHISMTTYMMWHADHLRNVIVLQRAHLLNFVSQVSDECRVSDQWLVMSNSSVTILTDFVYICS